MKKIAFVFVFYLLPIVPAYFYLASMGFPLDSYGLSILFAVFAFMYVGNQYLLASSPRWLISALGHRLIASLHAITPLAILAFALTHKFLKELNGFSDETAQGKLGGLSWGIFLLATVIAVFLMANVPLSRVAPFAAFKKWVYARFGVTYRSLRGFHNVVVIASGLIVAHVVLASTSSFSGNPVGTSILLVWMVVSIGFYVKYRLSGRKRGK